MWLGIKLISIVSTIGIFGFLLLSGSSFGVFSFFDSQDAYATFAGINGQIAFKCSPVFPNINNQICLVDADGSNRSTLTSVTGNNRNPDWSPDGTKIAFDRSTLRTIVVSTAVETNLGVAAIEPAWSPDGTKIAYTVPSFA